MIFDIVWFDTNLNRFIRLKETMDNGSEYQITGKFIDDYSGKYADQLFQFWPGNRFESYPCLPNIGIDISIVVLDNDKASRYEGRSLGWIDDRWCVDIKKL